MVNNQIKYIVVQAGGKGTRMGHLTWNKPKCLISINNKPILFHLFSIFKNAKFIIISDYKSDVLKTYLKNYANDINYQIIKTNNSGTCSGIKQALTKIPKNNPFILMWSDLLFLDTPFKKIKIDTNIIGLSGNFVCRWQYRNKSFQEEKSKKFGVAGFFIFENKKKLKDVPTDGEFVRYLKDKKIEFKSFTLKNTIEIHDLTTYEKYTEKITPIRPFNQIVIKKNIVVKKPLDNQGKKLIKYEKNFYKNIKKYQLEFFPKVISTYPLTLEKINGKSLFYFSQLSFKEKKVILVKIADHLKKLHSIKKPIPAIKKNDEEAIVKKTYQRLNQIKDLIPNINDKFFIINNIKCLNYYQNWHLIEKEAPQYYPSTYSIIHGDPTFSNTMLSKKNKIFFLDPRGYYGNTLLYGDIDYDWAKVYYSLKGNYDQFNLKKFKLFITDNKIDLKINSNRWEELENYFFELINVKKKKKVLFYHGIIWLSLTTYVWDNLDSILGAFYNGIYHIQRYYDKKTS